MFMGGRDSLLARETSKPQAVSATIGRFWSFFKHFKRYLLAVGVLIIFTTYVQVLIPQLLGQAVNCYMVPGAVASVQSGGFGIPGAAASQSACTLDPLPPGSSVEEYVFGLGKLSLFITVLFVATSALTGLQYFLMSYAGQSVLKNIRVEIFKHIQRLSLGYFSRNEAGNVMSRVTNDADTIQQAIQFPLIAVVQGVLLIGWVAVQMFVDSAGYALISLSIVPFMFVATRWFSNQARKAYRQVRAAVGDVNASLQERISSVKEAQAFSRENDNIEEFVQQNAASRDANIRAVSFTSALSPTLEAFGFVSMAIVAGVGGYLLLSDTSLLGAPVSLGLIIAFIAYTQRLNQPISQISVLWTNVQSAIAGGERIFGFLDEVPDIQDKPGAPQMPRTKGRVVFDHVWAEYEPGEPVLCDISLVVEPGQTIAIVGPTGAGKTTLVNLIPRFFDVTRGSVTIDGIDVREVNSASLRSQIGIVPQDPFMFSTTIKENIRYGRPDATDDQIIAAARLARADTFIERLPNGYDTVLGERGAGISMGQRQLLAIARAAIADPRILILDEATSSVDTRTERLIQVALEDLLRERTSFVIAHRLSTVRHADMVIVVRDGEIVERGTHNQLLEKRGFFYELYQSQFQRSHVSKPQLGAVPVLSAGGGR